MVSERLHGVYNIQDKVLILVVVEYGLGETKTDLESNVKTVLILVVVEYGLGVLHVEKDFETLLS